MRKVLFILLLFCFVLVPLFGQTAWTEELSELTIQPDVMDIDTFYSGRQVTISGEVANGREVIVEVTGPTENDEFDLKGRVGPFWMTRDKAEVDGAPAMYVLLLPGDREWRHKLASLGLGFEKLREDTSLQSTALPPDDLFDMFLKLKQSQGLYLVQDNAFTYASAENGRKRFTAVYRFPSSTATGTYTIKATAFTDGVKGMERSRSFRVDEVGLTRLVYDMATNQRLMYGILAVVIALFAGALISLLFRGGGSGSH